MDDILTLLRCCVLSWSVVTVMLPAFFLGAAIKAFVPSHLFLRYLGPQAPAPVAYGAAMSSGMVLSLCSCNVLPLFLSIFSSGAGVGPAFAFLFAGPAINVVTIVFTGKILGLRIALWRVAAVIVMSLATGVVMARLAKSDQPRSTSASPSAVAAVPRRGPALAVILLLVALVILGAPGVISGAQLAVILPLAGGLLFVAWRKLEREFFWRWMRETGVLLWKTIPILVPGIVILAYLAQKTPPGAVQWLAGSGGVGVTALASAVGALMYFPILTETAFVKTLASATSIGTAPAMALLLTGPGLSLPGIIVVGRDVGLKKPLCFVVLLIVFATVIGLLVQWDWGACLCTGLTR